MKLDRIKACPLHRGRKELIAHMEGKRLTRGQAIKAKCYECNNGFPDGWANCSILDCPLNPYFYRGKLTNEHTNEIQNTPCS